MKSIPEGVVRQVWEHIAIAPEREVERLTANFGIEQPAIIGYLLKVDSDILNRQERQVLFYLGMVIWQVMTNGERHPPIDALVVEQADHANAIMLEAMMGSGESDLTAAAEKLLTSYHQPAVLQYAVSALVQAADNHEVRQDNIGVLLIDVKTIVDCFDPHASTAGA